MPNPFGNEGVFLFGLNPFYWLFNWSWWSPWRARYIDLKTVWNKTYWLVEWGLWKWDK